MKSAPNNAPVFALDETTTWEDLDNAMIGCVEYQSSKLGKILPLMFFAPLTEPENLDAWEPMKKTPDNLLIASIERSADATLLEALKLAEDRLGEMRMAATCPEVQVDQEEPLADVYRQMEGADIAAYAMPQSGPDDVSFFFLLGNAAVLAFDHALREVTR